MRTDNKPVNKQVNKLNYPKYLTVTR